MGLKGGGEGGVPRVGELFINVNIDFTEYVVELPKSSGHVMMHDTDSSMVLFFDGNASERDFREIHRSSRASFIYICSKFHISHLWCVHLSKASATSTPIILCASSVLPPICGVRMIFVKLLRAFAHEL